MNEKGLTADPQHAAGKASRSKPRRQHNSQLTWRLEVGAAATARPAGPASRPPAAWFSLRMSSAVERARSTPATCLSSSPSTAYSIQGKRKLLHPPRSSSKMFWRPAVPCQCPANACMRGVGPEVLLYS
jgi:hypothetical protein